MNWTHTPAQRAICAFHDMSISEAIGEPAMARKTAKPRYSDMELLEFIAKQWRQLKRPPKLEDLNPRRAAIKARFGSLKHALRRAAHLLTPEERQEYVLRCKHCGRANFKDARGLASHQRRCEEKQDER